MMVARRVLDGELARASALVARAMRSLQGSSREDLEAAHRQLVSARRALAPTRAREDQGAEQLFLALALRIAEDAPVDCPLGCPVRAVVCVARQVASEAEVGKGPAVKRSSPAKRGRLSSFVQCRTELCRTGASVRALLGDTEEACAMAERAPSASDTSN